MLLPSNGVSLSVATSTSSRQLTLMAKVSSPFGARPRENEPTPQVWQNR